jgi:hypothetical protein
MMGMYRHSIGQIVRDGNTRGDGRNPSKTINANDDAFDFGALAFSGNTVGGKVALAA